MISTDGEMDHNSAAQNYRDSKGRGQLEQALGYEIRRHFWAINLQIISKNI